MDSANFINFIKNPGSLHQLSFQELNSLIETYPYCQNLHFMVMMKAKVEQHKDFEKKLGVASTYCADRKFLFQQIQDPIRPEPTSDSHYGSPEMTPVANDPAEEVARSKSIVDPPIPVIPDEPEIPEEITDTNQDTPSPEYINDQKLDPGVRVIEDESGSQLIIKKEDMPMHPDDEKRKVVFLEDLFDEKEKIKEIPVISQNKVEDEEIPLESEAPIMDPVPEEIDEPELPLEDDDIFTVESDAVSDHDMGIPISDADTQSDQSDQQELPQENLEEATTNGSPGFDSDREDEQVVIETDIIAIPDHIIDDIPFEITNPEEASSQADLENEDENEDEDELGYKQEEAYSEEGNDKISEQSTGISVVDEHIRMENEEDDNKETPKDNLDKEEEQKMKEDHDDEETEELTPLPKIAFKSWPGQFKPTIPKAAEPIEETVEEKIVVEEKEEVVSDETKEVKEPEPTTSNNLDIIVEETEAEIKEEKRAVDLTKVIKEHKAKKKKKAAKAKKKKKAKKGKAKTKENKEIEEEPVVKAKKKKKGKDKKKKKKAIKQLAQKSLTLSDDIISETLAELLVDQGSNKKAIKMYKKLSLIFPEKSAFFAAQIKKLKK